MSNTINNVNVRANQPLANRAIEQANQQDTKKFEKEYHGDDNDNKLVGTDKDELFTGGGGDDVIRGRAGDDEIFGNAGNDKLYGGKGNDYIRTGYGDDYVHAGAGDDWVLVGHGNNKVNGGKGFDHAQWRGSIEDFNVQYNDKNNKFTVTNKETGEASTLKNIERFVFGDNDVKPDSARVFTVEQLLEYARSQKQE